MSAGVRRPLTRDLVGRDFARVRPTLARRRARVLGWLLVATFGCALGLVALRIDILRLRYAMGEALNQEQELTAAHRQHLAEVETLRDPTRLSQLARERGFGRPDRILELHAPAAGESRP